MIVHTIPFGPVRIRRRKPVLKINGVDLEVDILRCLEPEGSLPQGRYNDLVMLRHHMLTKYEPVFEALNPDTPEGLMIILILGRDQSRTITRIRQQLFLLRIARQIRETKQDLLPGIQHGNQ
jgi:hypothetical protein